MEGRGGGRYITGAWRRWTTIVREAPLAARGADLGSEARMQLKRPEGEDKGWTGRYPMVGQAGGRAARAPALPATWKRLTVGSRTPAREEGFN